MRTPAATSTYTSGLAPSDLQDAYKLTAYSASNGSTETVAIVDAYNDPTAEQDLAHLGGSRDSRAMTRPVRPRRSEDE